MIIKSLLYILSALCVALLSKYTHAQSTFEATGSASYYASHFHGKKTASGEIFSNSKLTCAHKTLPFGTRLKVTNLKNGKWVVVTVNDRGPFVKGRITDLSQVAAKRLDFFNQGLTTVRIEEVIPENECRLTHEHDTISAFEFPLKWMGNWCGILESFDSTGLKTSSSFKLSIESLDNSRWQWTLSHDSIQQSFLVLSSDSTNNRFVFVDSKGIEKPAFRTGNAIFSISTADNIQTEARYQLANGEILYSMTQTSSTLVGSNDHHSRFFPIPLRYQVATLRRQL